MKKFYQFHHILFCFVFVLFRHIDLSAQEAPDVTVAPSNIYVGVNVDDGLTATRSVTLTNNGTGEIEYYLDTRFSNPVYEYSTGFENFELGDIDMQNWWIGLYFYTFMIEDTHPFRGRQHIRGTAKGYTDIAQTHYPGKHSGDFTTASMEVAIEPGTTWSILTEAEEGYNGRVIFTPDEKIVMVYYGGGGPDTYRQYDTLEHTIPEGYFNIAFEVDKVSKNYKFFLDGVEVFEGRAFTTDIEYVTLLSGDEISGSTIDVDNIAVYRGKFIPRYLTLSSHQGTVPAGDSVEIDVHFDGNIAGYGLWQKDLMVYINNTVDHYTRVQTTFRVVGPVVEPLVLESLCSDSPDSLRRWRIANPNDFEINAEWTIVGSGQSGSMTVLPGDTILYTNTVGDTTNTLTLTWLDELFEPEETTAMSEFNPCTIQNLNLTSMCYEHPDLYRRWRIRNSNPFNVRVAWEVVGTTQTDSLWATPGDTFFYTRAIGSNGLMLKAYYMK